MHVTGFDSSTIFVGEIATLQATVIKDATGCEKYFKTVAQSQKYTILSAFIDEIHGNGDTVHV